MLLISNNPATDEVVAEYCVHTPAEAGSIVEAAHAAYLAWRDTSMADRERGERIARDRLEAGPCFVNAFTRSDPRLPFGGIKGSGVGRELRAHGIRQLCNIKTVYVD